MPRRAFVGLSGPLLYDYKFAAETGPADLASSPNPILDSPFGLLLLYDEIWFLTRSLCPQNMRGLPYVRFLDEDGGLPDVSAIDVEPLAQAVYADPSSSERLARVTSLFTRYDRVLRSLSIDWDSGPDNHTHGLQIGGVTTSANSVHLDCILFDIEVAKLLGVSIELVANSFGQRWMDSTSPQLSEADVAHVLTIDRIPNFLGRDGPYHPVIEEARNNPYLKDFRRWITETSSSREITEVSAIKAEVEAAILDTERRIFLTYLDEHRRFITQGKTLTGALADLLTPMVGTASTVIQNMRERKRSGDVRWQGFLASLNDD